VEKAKKMAEERRRWDEHVERKKVFEEKREVALKDLGGEGTEEETTTSKKRNKKRIVSICLEHYSLIRFPLATATSE
jgi:hypothetical protein